MKKIYTSALALCIGVATMAADNHPRGGNESRSVKDNSVSHMNMDGRINRNTKVREQDKDFSSRYGNDTWRNRNDHNDSWGYATDRYQDGRSNNDYDHDRNDQYNRSYDRNDHHSFDKVHNYSSDRSYGNGKRVQRRF